MTGITSVDFMVDGFLSGKKCICGKQGEGQVDSKHLLEEDIFVKPFSVKTASYVKRVAGAAPDKHKCCKLFFGP